MSRNGEIVCDYCGGAWPWSETPRETWPSPYSYTWDSERKALAYLRDHHCGRRHMRVLRAGSQ